MQTQLHGEDFTLEVCALLLCSCSGLLRKLQKELHSLCCSTLEVKWAWGRTGQFREHRLWNTLLKTKLHSCLHSPLSSPEPNSFIEGNKRNARVYRITSSTQQSLNYCALFIKGWLISPHHLWFEVHTFMFDFKQQQFAFLANTKWCFFIGFLRSPKY